MKQRLTVKNVIAAIEKSKGMMSIAGRQLGCSRATVYNYAARYPEVQQAIDEQRETMVDMTELALYNRIQKGDGWAICFMLKTQGKDRGYVERTEHRHGGDPDNPAPIETRGTFTIVIDRRQDGDDADDERATADADL